MKRLIGIAVSIVTLVILFSFKSNSYDGKGICIIVNSANTVAALTDSETKLYYLTKLKKRWPDINKNIQPVDRVSACPERDLFYSKVLGMEAESIEKYFAEKEYQNAEPNRKKVKTDAEMIQFVAENIGAIGFVNPESLNGNKDVKVVLTIQ